jgi:branched-chain amino acid transport system permease protein
MIEWLADNAPLLRTISVLALLGYSVHLALRSGVFSFATVGFFAVGGYLSANLLKEDWNRWIVLLVVLVVSALLASALTPALGRLQSLYLAMATLAFTLFVQAAALSWPTYTGGASGIFGVPRSLLQGEMFAIVVVVVVLVWVTQRGVLGRATTAIRHDEVLSASAGVDVRRNQAAAFVGSSVVGAVAGFVQVSSFGLFGPTDVSFGVVVTSLTVAVVGGALAWQGPLLGAVLIGALPVYLDFVGEYNLILQAILVLALVVYQPSGLVGMVRLAVRQVRRLRRRGPAAHAPAADQKPEETEVKAQ